MIYQEFYRCYHLNGDSYIPGPIDATEYVEWFNDIQINKIFLLMLKDLEKSWKPGERKKFLEQDITLLTIKEK